ncbi:hypothetical protein SERLA73DRAFT_135229, partial [Serpula lacrymans var. lacrymans S7.3]
RFDYHTLQGHQSSATGLFDDSHCCTWSVPRSSQWCVFLEVRYCRPSPAHLR